MVVAHLLDLVEGAKLERAVLVDGRADVVAVLGRLDNLQLAYARDVGQPRLDVGLVRDVDGLAERTPLREENAEARKLTKFFNNYEVPVAIYTRKYHLLKNS
jgi:hypothetical protein